LRDIAAAANLILTKEPIHMKKKIISDIRLFKSEAQNEYGGYITGHFGDKKLNAVVKRVVMKLRENEFSLGEFDHLYINFTLCDITDNTRLSDKVDRYHPWYRYCDVHVDKDLYHKLGAPETWNDIIHWISTILVSCFASEDFDESRILSCIRQAVEQGEDMLIKFKEKAGVKRRAVIFLRFTDSCKFYPLLRVYDAEDHLLFEKNLPEVLNLDCFGEIQISAKKVTIKPRKNAYAAQAAPLVFEY
jgi:hypothetical protein